MECTVLGKIVPLWGVLEDAEGNFRCECGKSDAPDCRPGKHPRAARWKKTASDAPEQIGRWLEQYPHANFGILCGDRTIAVDADQRPNEGKVGAQRLEWIELDHGQRLPFTVIVESGRGNGSKHIYFRLPANIELQHLHSPYDDVDLIRKGYCVAPGSRHINGGYYHFADEASPAEQEIADMPKVLLDIMCPGHDQAMPDARELPAPGKARPDSVVLRQLRRDAVARRLFFDGQRRFSDRSRDDFALACKLAFYCSHHWTQAVRLFRQSALFGAKNHSWSTGNYVNETLTKAFLQTEANWTEKPKKRLKRTTGGKVGRTMSPVTTAVLNLHQAHPGMEPKEIAEQLGHTPARVRNILHRHRQGFYSLPASHPSGAVPQFGTAITQGVPAGPSAGGPAPCRLKPVPMPVPEPSTMAAIK